MTRILQIVLGYLLLHGYGAIALGLLIDAFGFPFPGDVLLLTTGFLIFKGSLQLQFLLPIAILAALIGDTLTFSLGRYLNKSRGANLLWLYRMWTNCTFSSKACHEKAQRYLNRYQGRVILFGKFLWGAREFIPPLAGMSGISYARFIALDALGTGLWILSYVTVGILLGDKLEPFVAQFEDVTPLVALVIMASLAILILTKYIKRKRFGSYSQEHDS